MCSQLSPVSESIQEKQNMLDTAAGEGRNSSVTFSCELLHMDVPVLADQQKHTFICSVWILDKKQWMIGTDDEKETKESMQPVRIDDDDDDDESLLSKRV